MISTAYVPLRSVELERESLLHTMQSCPASICGSHYCPVRCAPAASSVVGIAIGDAEDKKRKSSAGTANQPELQLKLVQQAKVTRFVETTHCSRRCRKPNDAAVQSDSIPRDHAAFERLSQMSRRGIQGRHPRGPPWFDRTLLGSPMSRAVGSVDWSPSCPRQTCGCLR